MLLKYDIGIVGMGKVNAALSSIERRFAQHNARLTRETTASLHAARRAGGRGAGDPIGRQYGPNRAALEKAATAAQHRQIMGQIKAEERARVNASRAAARAEAERMRQQRRGFTEIANAARAAERREMRDRIAARRSFARGTMGVLGGAASTLGGIGRAGLGLVGIGGSIAAGAAVGTEMSERARASQLANQAGKPQLKGQLLTDARGVKGFTGMEALNAMGKFTDVTGDLQAARSLLPELGQLALATGTEFEDLAAAAGNAFIPLSDQIKDPQERLKALMSTMRSVAGMGGVGAVEIKDLATEMAGLAAASNKFKGDPADLMKSTVAMAQAARQRGGAASAAEAVTSVARFTSDIIGNSGKFTSQGINVFSDKSRTKLADPQEIMVQMLKKTGGDLTKINKLFGVYAERAVSGFAPLYTQAGGGAAGEAAVRGEFERLKTAELSPEQMAQRAGSRLQDEDIRFKEAMKGFNAAVGKELLPVASQLIAKFTELAPTAGILAKRFVQLIDWLGKNPWSGIGLIVAGVLGKEIVAAGIPKLIQNAFGGGTGGSFGGKTTGAGIGDALSAGFTVGTITAGLITAAGIKIFEDSEASVNRAGRTVDATRGMNKQQLAEDIAKRKKDIGEAEEKLATADKFTFGKSALGTSLAASMGPFGAIMSAFAGDAGKVYSSEAKSKKGFLEQVETEGGTGNGAAGIEEFATSVAGTTGALNELQRKLLGITGAAPPRGNSPSPVK